MLGLILILILGLTERDNEAIFMIKEKIIKMNMNDEISMIENESINYTSIMMVN